MTRPALRKTYRLNSKASKLRRSVTKNFQVLIVIALKKVQSIHSIKMTCSNWTYRVRQLSKNGNSV